MVAVGRLHVSDKVLHFCACLALSPLPVIGFRDRRSGIVAGLSMFPPARPHSPDSLKSTL
jgi:hypothetical protein